MIQLLSDFHFSGSDVACNLPPLPSFLPIVTLSYWNTTSLIDVSLWTSAVYSIVVKSRNSSLVPSLARSQLYCNYTGLDFYALIFGAVWLFFYNIEYRWGNAGFTPLFPHLTPYYQMLLAMSIDNLVASCLASGSPVYRTITPSWFLSPDDWVVVGHLSTSTEIHLSPTHGSR